MATITGLRLEQLGRLASATTGNKVYTVSPSNNSYYMTMYDFGKSVDRLFISGNYISSLSGANYVNITDNQVVTGVKQFNSYLIAPIIYGPTASNYSVDLNNGKLLTNSGTYLTLDWNNTELKDKASAVSLNWGHTPAASARTLSGAWRCQSFTVPYSFDSSNRSLVGLLGNSVFAWGDAENRSYSDFAVDGHLYVGGNIINTEERIMGDGTNTTIEFGNSLLVGVSAATTLDWKNRIIHSAWTGESLYINRLYSRASVLDGVDLENRFILNSNGIVVYDWGNNIAYSSDENTAINIEARYLSNSSNSPVLYWDSNTLTGDWHSQALCFNEYKMYSDNYDTETQQNDLTLFNNGVLYNQPIFKHVGTSNYLKFYEEVSLTGHVKDSSNQYVMNVDTKTMTGVWTVEQLQGIKLITSGQAPANSSSPGISGQIIVGNTFIYMHTGLGWGRVALSSF